MNKYYSLETRKTVLEMYQAGKPVKEITQQTGVSRTHVYGAQKAQSSIDLPQ